CRFRDARRAVSYMAWEDGPWYKACEAEWQAGQFYKLRAVYAEHEKYGPQLAELANIRAATEADRADGFDPGQLVESSRYDPAALLAELQKLVTEHVADEPLRKLVLTLLERHA